MNCKFLETPPYFSDEPATTVKVPVMVVKALTHGDAATKTKYKQQGATQHQEANQQTGRLENTYFPEIEFLTTEEFEQVPKWVLFWFQYCKNVKMPMFVNEFATI
jgi:hypothetical protein